MVGKQFFGSAFKDVKGLLSLKTDQAAGDGTWDSAHAGITITAVTRILLFKCLRASHCHWSSATVLSPWGTAAASLPLPSPLFRILSRPEWAAPLLQPLHWWVGSNCRADSLGVSSGHHLIVYTFTIPLFNYISFLLMPIMFFFLFKLYKQFSQHGM